MLVPIDSMFSNINRANLTCAVFILGVMALSASSLFSQNLPPKSIEAFLSDNCFECHDDSTTKGDLNLLDLNFKLGKNTNFKTWERIYDRVKDGEMPPKKKPRPDAEKQKVFLKSLKEPLLAADLKDKADKGRVQVRRLTRREYEHTVHDLLGVDLPLQEHLPEDPVSHGFETVAAGQQLSHYNLAAYLEAADLALNDAFNRATKEEKKFSKKITPEMLAKQSRGNYRGPELRDQRSISWPIRQQFYGRTPATTVPHSGWYRITLKKVQAINPKNDAVWGSLRSGACNSSAPILYSIGIVEATKEKRDISFDAWIRAGHMLELKPNDATLKRAPSGAKGGNVSYQGRNLVKEGYEGIAIEGVVLERIYPNSARWEMRLNLFGGIKKEDVEKLKLPAEREAIMARVIRNFAQRAFRRPVSKEQAAPYVDLALSLLDEPDKKPVDGLRAAYRGILCSPRFLTFVEKPGTLDDHALASRLSYALWNSMPDKVLRSLADDGKLSDSKVFHDQVERLLKDPKSERFIESFTDQWLNLKEIDFTSPDQRLYRTFDTVVQDSMLNETRSFVREMIMGNYPVNHLIHSNFAMLNERLARFYGMKDLSLKPGAGLQKVSLGANPRGGLVTQGAVLKVSANGTTTSPVVRGVWVGERILGMEIPPPPANVPAVEPDIRGAVSIRDQLDKHRNSESCAACHVKIDPAGFALESFDPVGLWRKKYGTKKNAASVDPSGVTPEGDPFSDIREWKKIYMARKSMLAENFAKQLLTYATGAPPRFSDRGAVENIVKRSSEKEYRMRSIVHAVFGNQVFKSK